MNEIKGRQKKTTKERDIEKQTSLCICTKILDKYMSVPVYTYGKRETEIEREREKGNNETEF